MTGQDIRKIRLQLRLTQWQFAQAVGIRPGLVWMLEHGERKVTPELEKTIHKTLNQFKEGAET